MEWKNKVEKTGNTQEKYLKIVRKLNTKVNFSSIPSLGNCVSLTL